MKRNGSSYSQLVDSQQLKSEEGQGKYEDETQIFSKQWEFELLNVIF